MNNKTVKAHVAVEIQTGRIKTVMDVFHLIIDLTDPVPFDVEGGYPKDRVSWTIDKWDRLAVLIPTKEGVCEIWQGATGGNFLIGKGIGGYKGLLSGDIGINNIFRLLDWDKPETVKERDKRLLDAVIMAYAI